jgi:hypothetical protein
METTNRKMVISSLRRALRGLQKLDKEKTCSDSDIKKVQKALQFIKQKPTVKELSLSWFTTEKESRILSQKGICTISDFVRQDLREMRKLLRMPSKTMPKILLFLHPEK